MLHAQSGSKLEMNPELHGFRYGETGVNNFWFHLKGFLYLHFTNKYRFQTYAEINKMHPGSIDSPGGCM